MTKRDAPVDMDIAPEEELLHTYARAVYQFESHNWHSRARLLVSISEMMTGLNTNAYKFKLNHLVKTTMDATLMSDIELLYFRVIGRDFFLNFDFDYMSVGDVQLACICLACTIKECIQDILLH